MPTALVLQQTCPNFIDTLGEFVKTVLVAAGLSLHGIKDPLDASHAEAHQQNADSADDPTTPTASNTGGDPSHPAQQVEMAATNIDNVDNNRDQRTSARKRR